MLIDSNAYVGHWPFRKMNNNTCGKLLDRMKEYDVDISVISNLNGIFYKNTQPANEELYDEIRSDRRFSDRFIPFAVINPIYAGWQHDFEVSTGKYGMKGVRLYPKYHGYDLSNPSCIELVKRTRDLGLPVAFSLRMVDSRLSSWMDLKNEWALRDVLPIIKEVPDAKYLILNVANSMNLDDEETALLKNSDVLMDTSGRALTMLGNLLETYGSNKFAFGTHSPILDYYTGLLRIQALKQSEADEKTREFLKSGNAKTMLNI
jgi:predicted TIM-barrel fold metal-dependent hydrolase